MESAQDWPSLARNWPPRNASTRAPEAIACLLSEQAETRIRFEKVTPGDEQILPPREERELDALPSGLDRDEDA